MSVKYLTVLAYGERNYPVAQVKIPEHLTEPYDAILMQARVQYPAYTDQDLIRYLFAAGLRTARKAQASVHGLPDPNRDPNRTQS